MATAAPAEYHVDDLARAAGTTVRNVRSYAERGLLPAPERRGRTNVYTDVHLTRLRLVGRLLDRGYTAAHIADFVGSFERGDDLGRALGLESALLATGPGEIPERLSTEDLLDMFGEAMTAENVDRAVVLGLIRPDGTGYTVPQPRMVRAGAELVRSGVPLPVVLDLAREVQQRMEEVAAVFVRTVAEALLADKGADWVPSEAEIPDLVDTVARLRPLARVAVDSELARAMDEQIGRTLAERLRPAD